VAWGARRTIGFGFRIFRPWWSMGLTKSINHGNGSMSPCAHPVSVEGIWNTAGQRELDFVRRWVQSAVRTDRSIPVVIGKLYPQNTRNNLAMLAKQGWRLIQNPDWLCAQVLRAMYYPSGDVLNASRGHVASYTWRSILKGIQVLKNGVVWRIGNGQSINVWLDPWLPREWSRKTVTRRGKYSDQQGR
jgi:hypothetical protein